MPIPFNQDFLPAHGQPVALNALVHRVTATNANAFTFQGTNSYLIGTDILAIIDPGPDDDAHFAALLAAIGTRPVSHIFVTHSHKDHSALAPRLAQHFSAPIVAEGPNRTARIPHADEFISLDVGSDTDFTPDIILKDKAAIEGDGWVITGIATPGHMANHMVFALEQNGILFSGDHVMAWATTVIAPPDGNMHDYMASLERLLERDDKVYLPGHGGPVYKPGAFIRGLRAHRKMRECAILELLKSNKHTISEIVQTIYRNLDPKLYKAAGLSVFAHLEDLVARGLVKTDMPPRLSGYYTLA